MSGVVQVQVVGEDCRGKRSLVTGSSKDGTYGQTVLSASGVLFRSVSHSSPLVLCCASIITPFVRDAPDYIEVFMIYYFKKLINKKYTNNDNEYKIDF
jgi:hypothetical protein